MKNSQRGAVDPVSLITIGVICCVVGVFVPAALPWHWSIWQKVPPTKQLVIDQQKLAQEKAAKEAADKLVADAVAKDHAAVTTEVQGGQQMVVGAEEALSRLPKASRTQETALTGVLLAKASLRLSAAVGKLPKDMQDEIYTIVDEALSGQQAQIDAANSALEEKDREFKDLQSSKIVLETKTIPDLLQAIQNQLDRTEEAYQLKVTQVTTYADQAAKEKSASGSLATIFSQFKWMILKLAIILSLLYALVHYALPSLAQEYPACKWINNLYNTIKSITSAHK